MPLSGAAVVRRWRGGLSEALEAGPSALVLYMKTRERARAKATVCRCFLFVVRGRHSFPHPGPVCRSSVACWMIGAGIGSYAAINASQQQRVCTS